MDSSFVLAFLDNRGAHLSAPSFDFAYIAMAASTMRLTGQPVSSINRRNSPLAFSVNLTCALFSCFMVILIPPDTTEYHRFLYNPRHTAQQEVSKTLTGIDENDYSPLIEKCENCLFVVCGGIRLCYIERQKGQGENENNQAQRRDEVGQGYARSRQDTG
jgi:hypothetical protein